MSPEPAFTPTPPLPVHWADVADPAALEGLRSGPFVAVGVPVVSGDGGPALAPGIPDAVELGPAGPRVVTALDATQAERRAFTGKVGQTLVVPGTGATGPAVVFVGTGPARTGGLEATRRAAAELVRAAGTGGTALLVLAPRRAPDGRPLPPGDQVRAVQAATEGAILAAYRFVTHKSADERRGPDALVLGGAGFDDAATDAAAAGVRRGSAVGRAVLLARDLVNEPPSSMTPARLAAVAEAEVAGRPGVTLEVWDEERIAAERLGGLLGVARGSAEPPRLVRAAYEPADPVEVDGHVPHVVLVGKGITFDSGGLSLKTPDGMTTMKTDMSGAAAVLSAVSACGDLGVRVKVTAIVPATENMPGGRATKPGDVLTVRNGLTIEVLNTDAEGRLVLA
ncbi:MAG TPA: M17 family peptidase N-terminal domain-containing protein, partial [Acidimicrobiales bacterium]|nr:M17 family peptidase N-terminal domain-containing protein [Acidimicrobiales bacterium]